MPASAEVDAWFARSSHPLRAEMMRVREILLAADPRLGECIKWQTPTFTFAGNLASFNPNTRAHVSLMFHTGAHIPGRHPRLLGGGSTARYMKLGDRAEVEAARADLEAVVRAWIALKSGAGAKTPAKKTPAKKTPAKQTPAKRAPARKTPARKAPAKKAPAKKAPARPRR